MDITSLLVGIPGAIEILLRTSFVGYQLYLTARDLDADFSECKHQFDVQYQLLQDWALFMNPRKGVCDKFSGLRISDPPRYQLVVQTLVRIASIFACVDHLEGVYGMKPVVDPSGGGADQQVSQARLSTFFPAVSASPPPSPSCEPGASASPDDILKNRDSDLETMYPQLHRTVSNYTRLKWAYRDKAKLQTLIKKLKSYNQNLHDLTGLQFAFTVNSGPVMCGKFQVPVELPFPPNPKFWGRVVLLEKMLRILRSSDAESRRKVIILHGMGGIGKTQIALQYGYRHKSFYQSVFWVDAKDMMALESSARGVVQQIVRQQTRSAPSPPDYAQIACGLGIPGCLDPSGNLIHPALESPWNVAKRWFSEDGNHNWLLVVDNNDDLESVDLLELLPSCDSGHVIVTTRRSELAVHGHPIQVDGIDDGLGLILNAMEIERQSLGKEDLDSAQRIAQRLGGFPLALAHAASYMSVKRINFKDYLDRLDKDFMATLGEIPTVGLYRKETVFTWELSYRELGPSAMRLLHICAFLSNEDIPDKLLRGGESFLADWLEFDELDDAIDELLEYAFVERKVFEDKRISLHPIIHRWVWERLDPTEEKKTASYAIQLVASVLKRATDGRDPPYWDFERRIRGHLNRCSQYISEHLSEAGGDGEGGPLTEKFYSAVLRLVKVQCEWNSYDLSMAANKIALNGLEKTVGGEHPETLEAIDNMGSLLAKNGELGKALEWHQRALNGREKTLGREHVSTLGTLRRMATIHSGRGDCDIALELLQRVLSIRTRVLGNDHALTLETVHMMATVFDKKGEYKKAKELFQRAIRGLERLFGENHLSTLGAFKNMALLLIKQNSHDEALHLLSKALTGHEKILGPEHASTIAVVYHLARLHGKVGQHDKALILFERSFDGFRKLYGASHTLTVYAITGISKALREKGDYDKALQWCRRALEARGEDVARKEGGGDGEGERSGRLCKAIAGVFREMGILYSHQGDKLDKALEFLKRALLGYRVMMLGPDDPDIVATMESIARVEREIRKRNGEERLVRFGGMFLHRVFRGRRH